jgi:hypothetical protein
VSTTVLTPENVSMNPGEDIAFEIADNGDSVLGLARVIAQVTTNANVFRGWGPRVLI